MTVPASSAAPSPEADRPEAARMEEDRPAADQPADAGVRAEPRGVPSTAGPTPRTPVAAASAEPGSAPPASVRSTGLRAATAMARPERAWAWAWAWRCRPGTAHRRPAHRRRTAARWCRARDPASPPGHRIGGRAGAREAVRPTWGVLQGPRAITCAGSLVGCASFHPHLSGPTSNLPATTARRPPRRWRGGTSGRRSASRRCAPAAPQRARPGRAVPAPRRRWGRSTMPRPGPRGRRRRSA